MPCALAELRKNRLANLLLLLWQIAGVEPDTARKNIFGADSGAYAETLHFGGLTSFFGEASSGANDEVDPKRRFTDECISTFSI